MSCSFSQHLSAFHDGELAPDLREAVRRHLAECPACAAELTDLAAASRLFAAVDRPHLSQFSQFRIRQTAEALVQSDILKFVRVVRAIAACILIGASIWLWQMSSSSPAPEQVSAPPPQVDVAIVASEETQSLDATTPAAAWYLADASSRADDQGGQ